MAGWVHTYTHIHTKERTGNQSDFFWRKGNGKEVEEEKGKKMKTDHFALLPQKQLQLGDRHLIQLQQQEEKEKEKEKKNRD